MAFHAAALRLELFEHVPEHADAAADLRAAVDTFTELRATPWLQRARALHAEVATLAVTDELRAPPRPRPCGCDRGARRTPGRSR